MILTVDGKTYAMESQMRDLIINGKETTADEWNRPNSVEERINAKQGRNARHAFVNKAARDIVPRHGGFFGRVLRWLSQEV